LREVLPRLLSQRHRRWRRPGSYPPRRFWQVRVGLAAEVSQERRNQHQPSGRDYRLIGGAGVGADEQGQQRRRSDQGLPPAARRHGPYVDFGPNNDFLHHHPADRPQLSSTLGEPRPQRAWALARLVRHRADQQTFPEIPPDKLFLFRRRRLGARASSTRALARADAFNNPLGRAPASWKAASNSVSASASRWAPWPSSTPAAPIPTSCPTSPCSRPRVGAGVGARRYYNRFRADTGSMSASPAQRARRRSAVRHLCQPGAGLLMARACASWRRCWAGC